MARVPSLNWLRVFEAAARSENFARAADELGMSSAAVSQQLKALEERLGVALFERRAQSVELTEIGRAYLAPVQQSLHTLDSATEGLFGATPSQTVYVQSVLIFAHGILANALPRFAKTWPNVQVSLSTGNLPADFARSYADLRIVFGAPQGFGSHWDKLMGEMLFPVALPHVAKGIKRPTDLLGYPLIEVATHRAGWLQYLDLMGVSGRRAKFMFTDSTVMGAALASTQDAILLARAPASDACVAAGGLVPCLPDLDPMHGSDFFYLVGDDPRSLRPAARRFREWAIQEFRD